MVYAHSRKFLSENKISFRKLCHITIKRWSLVTAVCVWLYWQVDAAVYNFPRSWESIVPAMRTKSFYTMIYRIHTASACIFVSNWMGTIYFNWAIYMMYLRKWRQTCIQKRSNCKRKRRCSVWTALISHFLKYKNVTFSTRQIMQHTVVALSTDHVNSALVC